jgi:hypothetical protein
MEKLYKKESFNIDNDSSTAVKGNRSPTLKFLEKATKKIF